MTIRRKDDGTTSILKWGVKESTYRIGVMVLVFSMHPLGRQVLGTFGFKFPDERKVVEVATQAENTKDEIHAIAESVADLKSEVKELKANSSLTGAKVDKLELAFSGFQVDFDKYRKETK